METGKEGGINRAVSRESTKRPPAVWVGLMFTVEMIIPNYISKSHIGFGQIKNLCGYSHGKIKLLSWKWDTGSTSPGPWS